MGSLEAGGDKGENAFVIGLWEDKSSIDHFMQNIHDQITEHNHQRETYNKCAISYLSVEIPHLSGSCDNTVPIERTRYIEVADYQLHQGGYYHFSRDLKNIWIPAVSSCTGKLGGLLAKFESDQHRFLVVTFWESEEGHQEYLERVCPMANGKVKFDSYLKIMHRHQIKVNRAWDVIPDK